MKPFLIILLAVFIACMAGGVWAKAIYVPQNTAPPGNTNFYLLNAGGFFLLNAGGNLQCNTC